MVKYLVVFLFTITGAFCQEKIELSGYITDLRGHAVPFVSIYLKGTNIGTMANDDGKYSLQLDTGKYSLVFRFVGFKQVVREVDLQQKTILNISLEPDVYVLEEVSVGKKEDPAYALVRKVMANRKYLREVPSYSCEVYTKGVQKLIDAPEKILGQNVARTLQLDSNRRGIIYQSETKSKFYYQYPNYKEEMLASKVAGNREGFSFNRAIDLQVNLYHNLIQWKAWGTQSFVSPVADNAFKYYDYKLIGSTEVNGKRIYKIKIEPQRRYDPAFQGYIYLLDGIWRIYSVDLMLTQDARINFVDTLQISQQFSQVDEYWLPSDITFKFKGKVLGFAFAGFFTGLYSNYKPYPEFKEGFFDDEILNIPEDVNKKSREWWAVNRPIPLSEEEFYNYEIKDSIETIQSTKAYRDSVEKEKNRFKPFRFLYSGYTLHNYDKNSSWYFQPLNRTLFYNSTEGWGADLSVRYTKLFNYKRSLEFEPNARYSSLGKSLNLNAEITYRTDTLRHESFTLKGGSDFLDLNNRGTINLFYNTLTTLFDGKNYLKLYKSNFLSFSAQREIVDGLLVTGGAEVARRYPVRNRSNDSTLANAGRLLPNDESLFPINNSLSFETKLSYTYGQHYTRRPDGKIYEPARYPTVKLTYRKGIEGIFNSAVNYDFLSVDLYQDKLKLGLLGYSSFYLSAGKFLNAKSVFFPDLRHFTGNQTAVYNPLFPNFHFLDYYAYATNDRYYEAHYEHNFSGGLLKKIPLIRKLNLEEIIGGAYLSQPLRNYKEVYVGIQRLIFRFDYGFSWVPGHTMNHAFRLFYGF